MVYFELTYVGVKYVTRANTGWDTDWEQTPVKFPCITANETIIPEDRITLNKSVCCRL